MYSELFLWFLCKLNDINLHVPSNILFSLTLTITISNHIANFNWMVINRGVYYSFPALLNLKVRHEYNLLIKFRMTNSLLILSGKWVTQYVSLDNWGPTSAAIQAAKHSRWRHVWGWLIASCHTEKKLERRRGRHITTYWADKTEWEAFCHWSRQSLSMAKLARGYDKFHLQSVQGASGGGKGLGRPPMKPQLHLISFPIAAIPIENLTKLD